MSTKTTDDPKEELTDKPIHEKATADDVAAVPETNRVYDAIVRKQKKLESKATSGLLQIIANVAAIGTLAMVYYESTSFEVPPQLIPTDAQGSYFESAPLDKALHDKKELKQWYVDTIAELFTYTYRNIDSHSDEVSHKFSQQGLMEFDKFITSSKFATKVRKNYGIVEPVIDENVEVQEGVVLGRAGWQMSMKIALMIYINGKPMRAGVYDISSIVYREDENIAPDGIVIKNITLKGVK